MVLVHSMDNKHLLRAPCCAPWRPREKGVSGTHTEEGGAGGDRVSLRKHYADWPIDCALHRAPRRSKLSEWRRGGSTRPGAGAARRGRRGGDDGGLSPSGPSGAPALLLPTTLAEKGGCGRAGELADALEEDDGDGGGERRRKGHRAAASEWWRCMRARAPMQQTPPSRHCCSHCVLTAAARPSKRSLWAVKRGVNPITGACCRPAAGLGLSKGAAVRPRRSPSRPSRPSRPFSLTACSL